MALEQEYLLKQEEAEETYQKKLTAGSGININPTTNVISATGGGGSSVTYISEYPQGETIGVLEINDVQNPIKMPELIPGDNVTITPDPTTGALTIDSTGGGNVDDVKIGNTSIVDANKIANIPTMTGATSQAAGSAGVVPAPLATDVDKFLKADGTWDNCSSATELTKAQYDALPSSKESDGILYMINDIDTTSGTTSDLTRAEYDLLPASKESDDIFYYITDEGIIMHNGVQYAGGGSGGSGYSETSLWSGSDTATMILSDSFENYDAIKIIATANAELGSYRFTNTWPVSYLHNHINDNIKFGLTGDSWYVYFDITNDTTFNRRDQSVSYISNIIGIKYGSSSGSGGSDVIPNPSGTPTDTLQTIEIDGTIYEIEGGAGGDGESTEVDLWTNTTGADVGTYTLSNSIDDYDFIAIYYGLYSEYTSGILISDYRLVSVKDLNQLHTDGKRLLLTGWNNRTVYLDFDQTTMVISVVENGNTVLKVRGIKIGGGTGGGSYTETSIYTNSGTSATDITLTESYTNYDALYFDIQRIADNRHYQVPYIYLTSGLLVGADFQVFGYNEYISYNVASTTSFTKINNNGNWYVSEIIGIKFGGGSNVEANPQDTPTDTLETIKIGNTVYDIAGNAGGGGGISSEIIEIATGDGTTSRTFTFTNTPKRVAISWYEGDGASDWASSYAFTWGDHRAYGFGGNTNSATTGQYPKVVSITYGQDEKSFTITAGNPGSACNSSGANDHGYLWVDYGTGGSDGIESLADYTWTEILSTNGASGALSSDYNKLLYIAYYADTVQVYKVIDVAEMKKAMTEISATKYSISWTWNDNHGNYDTSYFYFDGTNVSIASGYSGVECKLFGANVSSSGGSSAGDGGNGIFSKSVIQSQNITAEFEYKYTLLESFVSGVSFTPPLGNHSIGRIGYIPTVDLGSVNESCTIYAVIKSDDGTSTDNTLIGCNYELSSRNAPNIFTRNGHLWLSVYGSDTDTNVSSLDYHVITLAIDTTAKKARYYIDGVAYGDEKSFNNSGRYVSFGGVWVSNTSIKQAPCQLIYGAVVSGAESESDIVANHALLMTEYASYIGN